jgi:hypothetical protein
MKTNKQLYINTKTNPKYWDCECKVNYIHLKDENNTTCEICDCHMDDQPDSRVEEVESMLLDKYLNNK